MRFRIFKATRPRYTNFRFVDSDLGPKLKAGVWTASSRDAKMFAKTSDRLPAACFSPAVAPNDGGDGHTELRTQRSNE